MKQRVLLVSALSGQEMS